VNDQVSLDGGRAGFARSGRLAQLRRSIWRGHWRRWVLRGAGLVVLAFLAVGAVLAWLTVNPRVNPAPHVDALLVLSTQNGAHEEAYRLAEAGVTDLLIVSAPGGESVWSCANAPEGVESVCFAPDPVTTQGEAMGGTALAHERGAQRLGVLTFDHHIERSRLLVERCWDGPLHMYEFEPDRSPRGYAYDFIYAMAAYSKTFLTPGCGSSPPEWLHTPIERIKD
jgi:hypothetical protein